MKSGSEETGFFNQLTAVMESLAEVTFAPSIRVKRATLDLSKSYLRETDFVQLWVQLPNEGKEILLCHLGPSIPQAILDLVFTQKDMARFFLKTNGNRTGSVAVHLAGVSLSDE